MITTVGQVLVNEALPPDLRDYNRSLDKKTLRALTRQIFDKHSNEYRDIIQSMMELGRDVAHATGSSVSLQDLRKSQVAKTRLAQLSKQIDVITSNKGLKQDIKDQKIIELLVNAIPTFRDEGLKEGLSQDNSFALQVLAGSRGNASQLGSLRGADLLVSDHKDRPVPIPITHSYSEGLDPVEYWAAGYGSRKGEISKKLAVADAGFLAKQLNNVTHRLIATDDKPLPGTGLPVDADDNDNIGSVLAADYGPYKAGTVVTPTIHKELKKNFKRLLVHSPIVSGTNPLGGVPRVAAGIRERGRMPALGENIGIPAAQALSEKLSQAQLSMKHTAGVVGASSAAASTGGFQAINQMLQVPKVFPGAATLAKLDGTVQDIQEAPQGGYFITVGREKHYVPADRKVTVKPGETVEAGDMLSEGVPNPAEIVNYKGIGEGRRYMIQAMQKVYKNSGIPAHRRNVELLARGLVNHVRVTDPDGIGDYLPDDVVEYDKLAAVYQPREGHKVLPLTLAKQKFLEKPVLHYSIGTRVTPRVMNELKEFNVKDVDVHDDPPQFVPEQHRAMDALFYSDDWLTSLGGFSISKIMQRNVQRGATSYDKSYSYIPGLAKGVDFGKKTGTPY